MSRWIDDELLQKGIEIAPIARFKRGNRIDEFVEIVAANASDFVGIARTLDEFFGENEGLLIAEVELQSEDDPFDRPAFLGREVTGDRKYYNSHLRKNPYILWRTDVQES